MDAAINCGATLDELFKWEQGGYPPWFVAKVIAFYEGKSLMEAHKNDAVAKAAENRKGKRK